MYDILIQNAQVADGTGEPRYAGDVAVSGDTIAASGEGLDARARIVIDASGQIVCPGFIDIHTHADIALMAHPEHAPKLMQGVTTEVFSNCGLGFAPVTPEGLRLQRATIAAIFGPDDGVSWDWTSVSEYLDVLGSRPIGTNAAYLIPHGAVRASVIGLEERPATPHEIAKMQAMVEEGMIQGAFGMSSGLWYAPMCYALIEESIELCRVVARFHGLYSVHMRDYGEHIDESLKEVFEIARQSGVRLQISHLAAVGPHNWGRAGDYIGTLDHAREDGIDVACDSYPYLAGSTLLHALLPSWASAGGTDAILQRLKDPTQRERIIADLKPIGPDWSRAYFCSVASDSRLEGKSFTEIAEARKVDVESLICDLLLDSELKVAFLIHTGNEADVQQLMQYPWQAIGSDGLHLEGKIHPRLYGTFARCLGHYARDLQVIPLEQAIHKMTGLPASRVGLRERGLLKAGMKADIVIFDPRLVRDRATYESPLQYPDGIGWVIVNGQLAKSAGQPTGNLNGRVLF